MLLDRAQHHRLGRRVAALGGEQERAIANLALPAVADAVAAPRFSGDEAAAVLELRVPLPTGSAAPRSRRRPELREGAEQREDEQDDDGPRWPSEYERHDADD